MYQINSMFLSCFFRQNTILEQLWLQKQLSLREVNPHLHDAVATEGYSFIGLGKILLQWNLSFTMCGRKRNMRAMDLDTLLDESRRYIVYDNWNVTQSGILPILRQMYPVTPKQYWPGNHRQPYVALISLSPNFHLSNEYLFQTNFETTCALSDTQITLNTTRSKVSQCYSCRCISNYSLFHSITHCFWFNCRM